MILAPLPIGYASRDMLFPKIFETGILEEKVLATE
jgi:hypothetical protein